MFVYILDNFHAKFTTGAVNQERHLIFHEVKLEKNLTRISNMNYLVAFILLIVVFVLTNENEAYGLSGYVRPRETQLMDPFPDMTGWEEAKNDASADLMERVVMLTNGEIHSRSGIKNYIIETTSMKKFTKEAENIYECRFMTVKKNGFSFGFSVVVWFIAEGNKPLRLLAIRSQPIGYQPSNEDPGKSMGKDFINYNLVKENHIPDKSDFDSSMAVFRDPNARVERLYIPDPIGTDIKETRANLANLRSDVEEGVNTTGRNVSKFLRNLEDDPSLVRGLERIGFETVEK